MNEKLTLWEGLDTNFKILLITSEIVVSGLVIWAMFYFFNRYKKKSEEQRKEMQNWKKEIDSE